MFNNNNYNNTEVEKPNVAAEAVKKEEVKVEKPKKKKALTAEERLEAKMAALIAEKEKLAQEIKEAQEAANTKVGAGIRKLLDKGDLTIEAVNALVKKEFGERD